MTYDEQPRGQPPIMPLDQPSSPRLPSPGPPPPDPGTTRHQRRRYFTVVSILFGFPTLVTIGFRSPMAFVFGFLLVVFLVGGAIVFAWFGRGSPPQHRA